MGMKLSQSLEDYLEMVHMLQQERRIARVKDIADAISVKMPSVTKAIMELKKLGLVTQEPYRGVELTPEGLAAASEILGRHILLKKFLVCIGVSEEVANKDACNMEHILSAETLEKIEDFVKVAEPKTAAASKAPAKGKKKAKA